VVRMKKEKWYDYILSEKGMWAITVFLLLMTPFFVGMHLKSQEEDTWTCTEWTEIIDESKHWATCSHNYTPTKCDWSYSDWDNKTICCNYVYTKVCIQEGKNCREKPCIDRETGERISCKEACEYYFKNCEDWKEKEWDCEEYRDVK